MLGLEGEEIHQSNAGWSPVYVEDNLGVMSIGKSCMVPAADYLLLLSAIIADNVQRSGKLFYSCMPTGVCLFTSVMLHAAAAATCCTSVAHDIECVILPLVLRVAASAGTACMHSSKFFLIKLLIYGIIDHVLLGTALHAAFNAQL